MVLLEFRPIKPNSIPYDSNPLIIKLKRTRTEPCDTVKCCCTWIVCTPVMTHCTMICFLIDKTTILLRRQNNIKLFFAIFIFWLLFQMRPCVMALSPTGSTSSSNKKQNKYVWGRIIQQNYWTDHTHTQITHNSTHTDRRSIGFDQKNNFSFLFQHQEICAGHKASALFLESVRCHKKTKRF